MAEYVACSVCEITCDPMERMVDGKTVAECLERYVAIQRDGRPSGPFMPGLSMAQYEAARLAWSAALRAKQEEARERERRQIVCDDDRWEVE